jgi:hypothetical protein
MDVRRQVYLGLDPQAWAQTLLVSRRRFGRRHRAAALRQVVGHRHPGRPVVGRAGRRARPPGATFCVSAADGGDSLALARGGDVFVYDPFGSEPGVTGLRWSPLAGCTDPTVCYRRVQAMTGVVARGITDGEHWRSGAAVILRAVFHAAALANLGLVEVRRWLAMQESREPAQILRTADRRPARGPTICRRSTHR